MIKAVTTSFVIPNFSATWALAGAIMLDEIGEISVNDETTKVAAHFFSRLQLKSVSPISVESK